MAANLPDVSEPRDGQEILTDLDVGVLVRGALCAFDDQVDIGDSGSCAKQRSLSNACSENGVLQRSEH